MVATIRPSARLQKAIVKTIAEHIIQHHTEGGHLHIYFPWNEVSPDSLLHLTRIKEAVDSWGIDGLQFDLPTRGNSPIGRINISFQPMPTCPFTSQE